MGILDDIMALPDRVGTIEKQLAKLTTELREQGVDLDALEATNERQDEDIRNLRTRADALADGQTAIETRLDALENPPPPVPAPDLTKYEEIADSLYGRYRDQWDTLARVGHDYARHAIDGAHWMYLATGNDAYRTSAYTWAEMVLDAALARDRNLDDLRLVSGFRLLGDEEINKRTQAVADRAGRIVMSTGEPFDAWVEDQHDLPFSWDPPQGEWQGVVGYAARCHKPGHVTGYVRAFRECVERDVPGVWGAGWEERYRPARSSFKAGRDVRLLELDESLRPIFEAAWGRIRDGGSIADGVTGGVAKYIDATGTTVGIPLFDGWNYVAPVDLLDRVLDDVMVGRSNLMADVNTHPTGVRQLALCGATALRRAKG